MSKLIKAIAAAAALFAFQTASADVATATDDNDVILAGYDAVAYFTEGKPVKGDDNFSTEYKDAEWFFSSQANLDAFLADPDRYVPQYGGYCAWAVSQGYTASGDPLQWSVVDDRLFLNYDASVQATWNADRANFIKQADKNWPKVLN